MTKRSLVIALAVLACLCAPAFSQKLKEKKKKEKRFEPIVKQDVRDYAGRYEGISPDYVLEIQVNAGGEMSIVSLEDDRRATVGEIKLDGPRLTGTKVYDDGASTRFEGVFVNRILNGESAFGIQVGNLQIRLGGAFIDKAFYRHVAASGAAVADTRSSGWRNRSIVHVRGM